MLRWETDHRKMHGIWNTLCAALLGPCKGSKQWKSEIRNFHFKQKKKASWHHTPFISKHSVRGHLILLRFYSGERWFNIGEKVILYNNVYLQDVHQTLFWCSLCQVSWWCSWQVGIANELKLQNHLYLQSCVVGVLCNLTEVMWDKQTDTHTLVFNQPHLFTVHDTSSLKEKCSGIQSIAQLFKTIKYCQQEKELANLMQQTPNSKSTANS